MTAEEMCDQIDDEIAPPKTPEEALDYLEELQSHIEGTIDGLKDDIESAKEED